MIDPTDPRRAAVEAGRTVVASRRKSDETFVAWAREKGLAVRVDRSSPWGNPYQIGQDGDRAEVIACYREHLASRPDLVRKLPSLRGKVLLCWCYPSACHGDVLAEAANALIPDRDHD